MPIRRRILIVDDDELMRVFYSRIFRDYADEFTYHLEESAEDALDYLLANRVDALITDWDLPGVNGIYLLKALRSDSSTKRLPIMMVSGRSGPGYMDIALKNGASDYFSKPFEVSAFLDRLRNLLHRAEDI